MRITTHYLLRPKEQLLKRIHLLSDSDLKMVLSRPCLIEHSEGGRSAWSPNDHALLVKLLWLASNRCSPSLEGGAEASKIFGSAAISEETFDECWSIERFVSTDFTESMVQALPYQRQNIKATGNALVDSWISQNANGA